MRVKLSSSERASFEVILIAGDVLIVDCCGLPAAGISSLVVIPQSKLIAVASPRMQLSLTIGPTPSSGMVK